MWFETNKSWISFFLIRIWSKGVHGVLHGVPHGVHVWHTVCTVYHTVCRTPRVGIPPPAGGAISALCQSQAENLRARCRPSYQVTPSVWFKGALQWATHWLLSIFPSLLEFYGIYFSGFSKVLYILCICCILHCFAAFFCIIFISPCFFFTPSVLHISKGLCTKNSFWLNDVWHNLMKSATGWNFIGVGNSSSIGKLSSTSCTRICPHGNLSPASCAQSQAPKISPF